MEVAEGVAAKGGRFGAFSVGFDVAAGCIHTSYSYSPSCR